MGNAEFQIWQQIGPENIINSFRDKFWNQPSYRFANQIYWTQIKFITESQFKLFPHFHEKLYIN